MQAYSLINCSITSIKSKQVVLMVALILSDIHACCFSVMMCSLEHGLLMTGKHSELE